MARICYTKEPNKPTELLVEGSSTEIVGGLVEIMIAALPRAGIDVNKFVSALPVLIEVKKADIHEIQTTDMGTIRRATEKGD